MFGYVKLSNDAQQSERGIFQTFMCGICKATKNYSSKARTAVGNDITFLNVLFHSFLQQEVEVVKGKCVAHPFKDRTLMTVDEVCSKLATANVLLTYLSLADHVQDEKSLTKKLAKKLFEKDFKLACEKEPELATALQQECLSLAKLEQQKETSIDVVSHPSAQLLVHVAKTVVGKSNKFLLDLCYNVGKWVYLIDACDDFNKDLRKKSYNPFQQAYGSKLDKKALEEISFLLNTVTNRAVMCLNDLNLTKYNCILHNVVYKTFRQENERVLKKIRG